MKKSLLIIPALMLSFGLLCCGCSNDADDIYASQVNSAETAENAGSEVDLTSAQTDAPESSEEPVNDDGTTVGAANAPDVTKAEVNTSTPAAKPENTADKEETGNGYKLEQLESAMTDCIKSNDWQKLNDYKLPGAKVIADKMIATEAEEAKYDYTYCSWYSNGSIKDYSDSFDELPSAEKFSYEYLDLKKEDENYLEGMFNALYPTLKYDHDDEDIEKMPRSLSEMAESVFGEYCGDDMKYIDLKVMKACAVDEDEYGMNMFVYVFVIETDQGYFFLCE